MNTGTSTSRIILLATDFSAASLDAEREALQLMNGTGGELHVLHVVEPARDVSGHIVGMANFDDVIEQQERLMDEVLARLRPAFAGALLPHLAVGAAAASVIQAASSYKADVVVVAAHRRSTLERWLLGSVSERIVRGAPCPVLVARPKEIAPEDTIEPPCPDCLARRQETNGGAMWCDAHTRSPRREAHRYSELPPSFGLGSMLIRPVG